jgi:hypothetical protein
MGPFIKIGILFAALQIQQGSVQQMKKPFTQTQNHFSLNTYAKFIFIKSLIGSTQISNHSFPVENADIQINRKNIVLNVMSGQSVWEI